MKKRIHIFKKIAYVVMATLVFTACQNLDLPPYGDYEIDPSIVTINYPLDGAAIKVYEDPASIDIEIEVHDDHLVSEISVALNGTEIANLTDFIDPRNIIETVTYNGLVIGDYVLTVTSTDVDGTSTSAEVNFTKEPPYTPELEGEILYMPFDGDYQEQVTGNLATQVGTPGFAGSGHDGSNAYQGAPNSYLTLPSAGLLNPEFSATFWLKIDPSDTRSGIINIAPVVPTGPADKTSGFGLIREGDATSQKFILLVGNGTGTSWVNPGAPATIDPRLNQWVHFGITISETTASLYMDGELVGQSDGGFTGIDWTGVEDLVIMSGDPNFNGWDHKTEKGQMDELRIFNKALTAEDIQNMAGSLYIPQYPGETFYMPFKGNYKDIVSNTDATEVGSPGFGTGIQGGIGYMGAADSYLTFPSGELAQGKEFSSTFWLKIDPSDTRSGIINIAPAEPAGPADKTSGFGLIREGSTTAQKFILLVGNGTGTSWVNPGDPATIDPTLDQWVHFGITISETTASLYMDGELVGQSDSGFTGIDWTGVGDLVIMSGDPNFNGWDHKTEKGRIDELRLYHKVLTQSEIQLLMAQ